MSQFIHLYGNLVAFMQKDLEKLNDTTTKQFQLWYRASVGLSFITQPPLFNSSYYITHVYTYTAIKSLY